MKPDLSSLKFDPPAEDLILPADEPLSTAVTKVRGSIAIAEVVAIIDAERASWGTLQDNELAWAAVSRIRAAVESNGT